MLPLDGWRKVNVDGSVKKTLNNLGYGGVIRDNTGRRVEGLSSNIRHSS